MAGGSKAERPRAFHSAVAGDRVCGRPSVFSDRVGLFKTNLTERPPMTNDMMNVRSLVEKSADADLLREMIGFAAERLMELEVGSATGADFGEKNPMAVRLGRCDLPQSSAWRTYCFRRSHHRRRRQQRWPARGLGHGGRHVGGRADLDGIPA
ncbi:hypothetical protein D3C87_1261850 [compost metagenome]